MTQQNQKKQLTDIATQAVEGAQKRGIQGVRAVASRSRSVSLTYRDGRPEKVEESTGRGLTLHLYVDGRYTACDTNDLRKAAIDEFLDSSVAFAKSMAPDPFRQMPDPRFYEDRPEVDLQLLDDDIFRQTPEGRHQYAASLEQAARENAGSQLISAESYYEDSEGEFVKLHSNGFEGYVHGSQYWAYAEISLQDKDDRRPAGGGLAGTRHRSQLESPETVARRAADAAMAKLQAAKIETSVMPMIVENRTAATLLGYLTRGLSARSLQQQASFLGGRSGEPIGSECLDLYDDPLIVGGFGSRLFDGEGISARRMPVFQKGVLKNFFIDTYYGKKLELAPTTGSSSNLILTPGTRTLDDLCADVQRGILVRGFLGGNSNTTTGDFSLGVHGTLIENGKPTRAISEMNIAGNHLSLWRSLVAVGNDPYKHSSVSLPSLMFDNIQFAGN